MRVRLCLCVSPVGALIAYVAHIIQLSFGKRLCDSAAQGGAAERTSLAKKRPKVAALANN